MPRIQTTPTRSVSGISLQDYDGAPLIGRSVGGVISARWPPCADGDALLVVVEEFDGEKNCALPVTFYGIWKHKMLPALKAHDRLFLSGPDIEIQSADPGGASSLVMKNSDLTRDVHMLPFKLIVGAPEAVPTSSGVVHFFAGQTSQISDAVDAGSAASSTGVAALGIRERIALQWEPLSHNIASAASLRKAASEGRVAASAGPNRVYSNPQLLHVGILDEGWSGQTELRGSPVSSMNMDENSQRGSPGGASPISRAHVHSLAAANTPPSPVLTPIDDFTFDDGIAGGILGLDDGREKVVQGGLDDDSDSDTEQSSALHAQIGKLLRSPAAINTASTEAANHGSDSDVSLDLGLPVDGAIWINPRVAGWESSSNDEEVAVPTDFSAGGTNCAHFEAAAGTSRTTGNVTGMNTSRDASPDIFEDFQSLAGDWCTVDNESALLPAGGSCTTGVATAGAWPAALQEQPAMLAEANNSRGTGMPTLTSLGGGARPTPAVPLTHSAHATTRHPIDHGPQPTLPSAGGRALNDSFESMPPPPPVPVVNDGSKFAASGRLPAVNAGASHVGADAGALGSVSTIERSAPIKLPGCVLLGDAIKGQKKVGFWCVILNWKAPMISSGSDKFSIMTVADDSSRSPESEGGLMCSDMKIFFSDSAYQPKPLFAGDIIFVQSADVQAFNGKIEIVQYKYHGGGTIFHGGLPESQVQSQLTGTSDVLPSVSHFGVPGKDCGHKTLHPGKGIPVLNAIERSRLSQLKTWWATFARTCQGDALDRRGFIRTFDQVRANIVSYRNDYQLYVDIVAMVAAYTPAYDRLIETARDLDLRVAAAGGPNQVMAQVPKGPWATPAPSPAGFAKLSTQELATLDGWVRRPEEVLLASQQSAFSRGTGTDPDTNQVILYLWDGSDPDSVAFPDRSHIIVPKMWAGDPRIARGSILRLCIDDNLAEVVRLKLNPGDWVVVRNLKLRLDKAQSFTGALDGNAGRAEVVGKNGKCGILRLPIARSDPLRCLPASFPVSDVRNRMMMYFMAQRQMYGTDAVSPEWRADVNSAISGLEGAVSTAHHQFTGSIGSSSVANNSVQAAKEMAQPPSVEAASSVMLSNGAGAGVTTSGKILSGLSTQLIPAQMQLPPRPMAPAQQSSSLNSLQTIPQTHVLCCASRVTDDNLRAATVADVLQFIHKKGDEYAAGRLKPGQVVAEFQVAVRVIEITPSDIMTIVDRPSNFMPSAPGSACESSAAGATKNSKRKRELAGAGSGEPASNVCVPVAPVTPAHTQQDITQRFRDPTAWMYYFKMRVQCVEAKRWRLGVALDPNTAIDIWVFGEDAQSLLPGLPACDLRASPHVANCVANAINMFLRDDVYLDVGIRAVYIPRASNAGTIAMQGTPEDPGAHMLANTVFHLAHTVGTSPKNTDGSPLAASVPHYTHHVNCTCQQQRHDTEQEESRMKRRRG